MNSTFSSFARWINGFVSSPSATAAAFVVVVLWAITGPYYRYSDTWQLVINTGTSIITFLMVFVLNNAQSRDTAAINSKLDAIILAMDAADNRLIGLEKQSDKEAEQARQQISEAIDKVRTEGGDSS
jgi:low affinity Fe/Cu permease